MAWFYNSDSGELTKADGLDALAYEASIHAGVGWHELNISDSATEAQAAAEAVKEDPNGTKPTTSVSSGISSAVTNNPITNAAKSVIPSTFNLVLGNTSGLLTRILKVGIGAILLIAGILKLSNTDKTLEQVLPLLGGPAGKVLMA